jgi:hypothetical protein
MSVPTTRQQLIDYCKRELGHPVIEINVDDDQIDDRVDQALSYFYDFHYDGTEKYYLKHQLTSTDITNQYITVDEKVIGINKIFPVGDTTLNSGNIFDIVYQFRLNDLWDMSSSTMTYYTMNRTHLEMVNQLLTGVVPIRFNRHTDKLYIDWDWTHDAVEGHYIIAECWRKVDPTDYPDVFSDRMLKKYLTALIKKQWGNNLRKFQGIQMPGGVTLDGLAIMTEATAEVEQIEQEIRDQYEAPPQFYVG